MYTQINTTQNGISREEYEKDLRKRQDEHLANIQGFTPNWQPCLHDSCTQCLGTGKKAGGSMCIHMISCSCPKCSPSYFKS